MARANMPNTTLGLTGTVSNTASGGKFVSATNGSAPCANAGFVSGGDGPVQYLNAQANTVGDVAASGSLTSGATASINGGVTQTEMNNVQPTIVCKCITRVI
jgi:hypothetical protein